MATAPAAEVLRKARRVGDDDFTDMVILLVVLARSFRFGDQWPMWLRYQLAQMKNSELSFSS
jgi:hypothetical protein